MEFSKIKSNYKVTLSNPSEDSRLYGIFFLIIKRLCSDRLFIRDVPAKDFAAYFGLHVKEFNTILKYCCGLTFLPLIELLRSLDAFAMARRMETDRLNLRQIAKLSNANLLLTDRLVYNLMGVSFNGFYKGARNLDKRLYNKGTRKGITKLRNLQQRRNTAFLEHIAKIEYNSKDKKR